MSPMLRGARVGDQFVQRRGGIVDGTAELHETSTRQTTVSRVPGELLKFVGFSSDVAVLLGLRGVGPRSAFPASAGDDRPTGRPRLVKHQLLILNRSRKRAPNLRLSDRVLAG